MRNFLQFASNPATLGNAIVIGIGFAFYEIALSIARDVIRPAFEILSSDKRWSEYFYSASDVTYRSLAEAEQSGVTTINYGNFFAYLVEFVIILVFLYGVYALVLGRKKSHLSNGNQTAAPENAEQPDLKQADLDVIRSEQSTPNPISNPMTSSMPGSRLHSCGGISSASTEMDEIHDKLVDKELKDR